MTDIRGLFISLEGIEGSGKSTLADALASELRASGFEVVVTAEPGGGGVSDCIRTLLLDNANVISDRAELLLFEAGRAQHVYSRIIPALERSAIVVCDRFYDSSIAYQGYARGLDLDDIGWLNDYATSGLRPDITILLDLPPEAGLLRQDGIDRISDQAIEFHESVRQGYLSLVGAEPERFRVIDASQEFDCVFEQALTAVRAALAARPDP